MTERQIKEFSIEKSHSNTKLEQRRLIQNCFAIYFSIYLDGKFFVTLKEKEYAPCHYVAKFKKYYKLKLNKESSDISPEIQKFEIYWNGSRTLYLSI